MFVNKKNEVQYLSISINEQLALTQNNKEEQIFHKYRFQ